MATKAFPGFTRRESYSRPLTLGSPLCARISAPCRRSRKFILSILVESDFLSNSGSLGRSPSSTCLRRLPSEANTYPRCRCYMRSSRWELLLRKPAADRINFQATVLRKLNGSPHAFAVEIWDDDSTLFGVQNHRPA